MVHSKIIFYLLQDGCMFTKKHKNKAADLGEICQMPGLESVEASVESKALRNHGSLSLKNLS